MILRFSIAFFFAFVFGVRASVYHSWVRDTYMHSGDGSVIAVRIRCSICGLGNGKVPHVQSGWCTCHTPPISVIVSSESLGGRDYADPQDAYIDLDIYNGELDKMPPSVRGALDWSGGLPPIDDSNGTVNWRYKDVGTIVDIGGGNYAVVSGNPLGGSGGYLVEFDSNGSASGYSDGRSGVFSLTPLGDGRYGSNFSPNWQGGFKSGSGSPSSLPSPSGVMPSSGGDGGSSSSSPFLGLPFVGSDNSGGYTLSGGYYYGGGFYSGGGGGSSSGADGGSSSSGGGSSSSGGGSYYENTTHFNYYFNAPNVEYKTIEVPVISSGGGSSSSGGDGGSSSSGGDGSAVPEVTYIPVEVPVVSVPSETVTLSDGMGGTVNITMQDYSSILNAIGGNMSSGFQQQHEDLNIMNENLIKMFHSDNDISADEPLTTEQLENIFDSSSVDSDIDGLKEKVNDPQSGWGFDFGFGSNPVGDVLTSLIGSPPTSFGNCDTVCTIDIPIFGDYVVNYSFKLSDYFPSAFRSCMLLIVSIFWVIAVAKTISGAFS